MTKGQMVDRRHNMSLSIFAHKSSFETNYTSNNRSVRALVQGLFNMFIKKENNESVNIEKQYISHALEENENETSSLQRLENCANAARETGAYSQNEWVNKTDE